MSHNCPRCGGPTDIMVQAVIVAPSELYHKFSKQMMRRKDVHFNGVLWETTDFICRTPGCLYASRGYGNYVTNLKAQNDLQSIAIKELHGVIEHISGMDEDQITDFANRFIKGDWGELERGGYVRPTSFKQFPGYTPQEGDDDEF